MIIYCFAARLIYKKRSQLEDYLNPFNEHPFTITWEVTITSEARTGEVVLDPPTELDTHAASDFRHYECNIRTEHNLPRKPSVVERLNIANISREVASKEPNAEAWLYARAAFLFYVTILITWVCHQLPCGLLGDRKLIKYTGTVKCLPCKLARPPI
jgi:hypothetical protein